MNRITTEERERFHKILDDSIDKMNNPKNTGKDHWSGMLNEELQKMINIENAELELAVFSCKNIESENFDLINLNMMMIDNSRGNKIVTEDDGQLEIF